MYTLHHGRVRSGFQFASGQAVQSPFSDGTIKLQYPHFKERGLDLKQEVPDLVWGTVNIEFPTELEFVRPDFELNSVDWASGEANPDAQIPPEDFWFARCALAYQGRYHVGLIYYPHPRTKPSLNAHNAAVLEVIANRIEGLTPGDPAAVLCRADAFATLAPPR